MFESMKLNCLFVSVVVGTFAASSPAQAAIAPEQLLGYELGERYTPHWKVLEFLTAIDGASDRLSMSTYGRTHERRELVLAFVTSPRNHARLEDLRNRIGRLADPRTLSRDDDVEAMMTDLPVFVWLSYNVHGNETSCTEAAMAVAHELATSSSRDILDLLEDVVVIIDPCINPDGRDRYVNWFNSVVGNAPDPDPASSEHSEPWPGGRYNHYCFDLNRDWAFLSQRETRARLAEYLRWNPQVHGDYHEMGSESTYFFFPAEKPINVNLPPSTIKWGEVFGRGNAAAFDSKGWEYYTAEAFDLFYPGYGDSWPSLQGAIGMTYEQAGGPRAGMAIERRDGTILHLRDRVAHHVETSLATIRTAASHRVALLRDFYDFRRTAIEEGRKGTIREYILPPGNDHERTGRLVDVLLRQGVEVRQSKGSFVVKDVHDYFGRRLSEASFPAGTYMVSLAQPTKRLIKTLLEPKTEIRELYFYDVAAWSLPYAFGVEAAWTSQTLEIDAERVIESFTPIGGVERVDRPYGYLLRWDSMASVKALVRLLDLGIVVKTATQEFTLDGQEWKRGTLVIPRSGNDVDLETKLEGIAQEHSVTFVAARTGMTEKGIDLGSGNVQRIVKPHIALLGGSDISATSFGATRYVLEELYRVPYGVIDASSLHRARLDRFTAIVVPSGSFDPSKELRERLDRWIADGGVLLAMDDAATALAKENGGYSKVSIGFQASVGDAPIATPSLRWIEDREESDRRNSSPGSIFKIELDPAHPLSFGYGSEIVAFQAGTLSFDPDVGGLAIGRFKDAAPLSGYLVAESERRMRDRGFIMVERRGRGAIILAATDLNFRSAWHGMSRLFLNAVLLMPRY